MKSLILVMTLVFGASFIANAQFYDDEIAELVITGQSAPSKITEGVPFTVSVTIKNEGTYGSGTFKVALNTGYFGGSYFTVSNLLPGQSITLSKTFTLPVNSNRTGIAFSWFADCFYDVPEEVPFLNNYTQFALEVN